LDRVGDGPAGEPAAGVGCGAEVDGDLSAREGLGGGDGDAALARALGDGLGELLGVAGHVGGGSHGPILTAAGRCGIRWPGMRPVASTTIMAAPDQCWRMTCPTPEAPHRGAGPTSG